jgi:hypothetical protein
MFEMNLLYPEFDLFGLEECRRGLTGLSEFRGGR